jgi:subtilisin family serine protease
MAYGCTARVAGMGLCSCLIASILTGTARAGDLRLQNAAAVTSPDVSGVWTDRVVVKLRQVAEPGNLEASLEDPRFTALGQRWSFREVAPILPPPYEQPAQLAKFGLDRYYSIALPVGTDTPALAAELARLTDLFELAEADPVGVLHAEPTDPGLAQQWSLSNRGQSVANIAGSVGADIDWLEAWSITRPVGLVVVAVLDTGVSTSHPDLAGQTVPGRCFVCGTGDPTLTDDALTLSHGTLCAGIIAAATDNGLGICGISSSAKIMPLKVTSGLIASQTYTGNAIIWAADHGAAIASMSWGFGATANVSYLRSAVEYAHAQGMLLVASTGNTPGAAIGYPARWPEVIAVGATNSRDDLFIGTTTGPEMDMVAPGQNILTTVDQSDVLNGYTLATGTSMAAPMVAAAAAELWAMNPLLTATEVRRVLEASADDLGAPGWDEQFGVGRLNLLAAVRALGPTPPPCAGDYDGDGQTALSDFFAFLNDYFQFVTVPGPGHRPDIDRSGSVDVQDLFTFMQFWFAGC